MTRLFKSAAGRGLTSSRYARLGQAPTGDLQTECCTNNTIRFWQEIFNENGLLVELHEKYPIDLGHQRQVEQDS
jgi:hypothetical protein